MDATWHPRGVTFGMSHVVHLCGGQKEETKIRKIRKNVRMTSGKGGKWWEVSPTLINSGMRIKREKEEKENGEKEGKNTERERKKRGEKKMGIFLAFQWSKLDGPRIKVVPRNENYA